MDTDATPAHPNDELHELVRLLHIDNERMRNREACVARAVLELQRLTLAKQRILEETITTLTGIRSDGSSA